MKIKYIGHVSFYLRFKTAKIITDPFDPQMVGISFPSLEADIVTVSHDHNDHNQAQLVKGNPLIVDMPGEYEKKGVKIKGFLTYHDKVKGQARGENVIYKIEAEDMSFLHCGDLGHIPSDALIEEIGNVDVLFVPVGGAYTIEPEEAVELVNKIEPAIVIPMHYNHERLNQHFFSQLKSVAAFLEIIGGGKRVDELSLEKQDLEGKEKEVFVLNIS